MLKNVAGAIMAVAGVALACASLIDWVAYTRFVLSLVAA